MGLNKPRDQLGRYASSNLSPMFYQDPEWLRCEYVEKRKSIAQIAENLGCGEMTIHTWLKKHKIPRRAKNETKINLIEITPEIEEFIAGLVLGDGHISLVGRKKDKTSARLGYSCTRSEYLNFIQRKAAELGFLSCIKGNRLTYETRSYPELLSLRERWYPNGKKAIPPDLQITPLILKYWFIGDGSYKYYGNKLSLVISSHIFSKTSLENVVNQLERVKISATVFSLGIRIRTRSKHRFFQYILSTDPEVPSCYHYKFPKELIKKIESTQ